MINKCLQAADIQQIMGLSEAKVYDLMHRRDFPSIRIGRRFVVPAEAFERWLMREAGEALEDQRPSSSGSLAPGR